MSEAVIETPNGKARIPIALFIAAVTVILGFGALFQRVDALERAEVQRIADRDRLVRMEERLIAIDHRLQRAERN